MLGNHLGISDSKSLYFYWEKTELKGVFKASNHSIFDSLYSLSDHPNHTPLYFSVAEVVFNNGSDRIKGGVSSSKKGAEQNTIMEGIKRLKQLKLWDLE